MANQPPSRPWFRMPNLARQPTTPAPAPTSTPAPQTQVQAPVSQQPRIPVIRPAFRPAFTQAQQPPPPPPPQQQQQRAPSPTPTQPPSPVVVTTAPNVIASPPPPPPAYISAVNSPISSSPSPKTTQFRTPIESPKVVELESPIKTTRSPPPITLPPQLNTSKGPEAEQEKVLLQETFNKKVVYPNTSEGNSVKDLNHKTNNNSHKHGKHKDTNARKSPSDSEDGKNVRIITMKGENNGALMDLSFPSRRNGGKTQGNFPGTGHILGDQSEFSNDDRSKTKDQNEIEMPSRSPMKGYVNSNVQGINNSIMYNCSFTHHDPGVHFSVSRKPIKPKGEGKGHGNHHENGKQV